MPRFAANLSMMYNEYAFLDRFAAAGRDGFKGVEYLFPYDYPAREIRDRLHTEELTQVLFNAPPGNWDAGERGIAALPGRQAECREGIATALEYATALGSKLVHVMAGIPKGDDPHKQRDTYLANLAHAADQAAPLGVTVLMEPINRRDMPGYFLNRQDAAHAIRTELGRANLKVQFDAYHAQITEGDLAVKLKRDMAEIGHIQIAGVPDRHEPDQGEINYPYLLDLIDQLGYAGWIGCEYRPAGETTSGLGWTRTWRR